jgi:Ca-activated chloride channel family protein
MLAKTWMMGAVAAAALLAGCGDRGIKVTNGPAPVATASMPSAEAMQAAHTINTGAPVDGPATLMAPASAAAGGFFEVDWTGPGNAADYIDIVPKGHADTRGEITYAWVRESLSKARIRAPLAAGEYEVRYILEMPSGRVVKARASVTVAAADVAFEAPPATAEAGAPVSVAWRGPGNDGDYIDIVPKGHADTRGEITYAWTRSGNPSQLRVPGAAGEYELRYVMEGPGGAKVVAARAPLTATPVAANLEAAPLAPRGTKVRVTWTGPARQDDYVDLVPKGFRDTRGELSYFYTRTGSGGDLNAPAQPGEYEIRYIMDAPGGRQVLARIPIRIT